MDISSPSIGKKVCETKKNGGDSSKHGVYAAASKKNGAGNETAICGGEGSSSGSGSTSPQYLKEFIEKTLKDDKNWPTSTVDPSGGAPTPETNDNAEAVAKDLVQELTTEEKTIVAGLLAKTIEGGEVVEIRAVSSTFVSI
ncbi:hypothetical protein ANAPC5_00796 [Anaplasma phagocytophilum]|nr:hypothetical protein ANAPC2_00934 [Anaplasma phagocytophilum]SBO32369.1 hypothetical protein ANAPC3_00840 [Anaplasma phagocytophilum]SBO33372.1 hypothetical protein ANAPC4_01131 [Anaplasma phagocytophilum]SCV64194.1 hypothetical protein ANAPC5_00796 [Anaplasma phagocytophilum]